MKKLFCLIVIFLLNFSVFLESCYSEESVILLYHMTPSKMMLDYQYKILLRIKNNDKFWSKNGKIRVSYHLLDLNKKMIVRDFVRTYLPRSVKKGEIIELKAKVFFSSKQIKPGSYLLQWDVVEEGVKWYSFQKLMKEELVYISLLSRKDFILCYLKQFTKFFSAIFITIILPGVVILLLFRIIFPCFITFISVSFLVGIFYVNLLYYILNIFNIPLLESYFYFITILLFCFLLIFSFFKNKNKFHSYLTGCPKWDLSVCLKVLVYLVPVFCSVIILFPIMITHVSFPNIYDLSTHASFVRKIFETGLSLSSQVFSFEVPWSLPEKGYYPLGSHRLVAIFSHIANFSPVDGVFLLFFWTTCFSPLTLMLFLRYFLGSKISILHLLLIGICVSLYPLFPYQIIGWGGLPLLFAMVLSPLLLIVIINFVKNPSFQSSILLSFCMFSIFLVHPTGLYICFILSILLFVPSRDIFNISKKFFLFGFISIFLFVLLILPEIKHICYVQFLRSTGHLVRPPEHWPFKTLILHFLGLKYGIIIYLFFGLLFLLYLNRYFFQMVFVIALFFLFLGVIENYVNTPLGNLWQHRIPRIYYNTYFYVPVLWGSGLYAFYKLLSIGDYSWWTKLKTFLLFFFSILLLFKSYPKDVYNQVSYYFDHYSGMNANDYAAIHWLRNNIARKDVIIGQHGDSSLWIYPYTGLKVFGGRTHGLLPYPDFIKRNQLQEKFISCASGNLIDELLSYDINYIYISRTIVKGEFKAPFNKKCFIKYKKNFQLIYKNSDVSIYKIIP